MQRGSYDEYSFGAAWQRHGDLCVGQLSFFDGRNSAVGRGIVLQVQSFLGNLDGTDTELLTDLILQLSVLCVFDDSII